MSSTQVFQCSNCDAQFSKWTGRCLECGKWGTVEKDAVTVSDKPESVSYPETKTQGLSDVQQKPVARTQTSLTELDRVLGGGIVPGSLILLGGEPGIGKSTLSIQLANVVDHALYVSGEESVDQVSLRAQRLGLNSKTLQLANETQVEKICATIEKQSPKLAIVDSIQTMTSDLVSGAVGSVNQIRACTSLLLETAKKHHIPIVLIGHVTKDGAVAGPKTLEHLVDTVLYLEGDRHHAYRILRTVKNRFGPTDEVGIFDMTQHGLIGVDNPSATFLQERQDAMPGSVVTCLMEGTRPLLIEIQALVNKTAFGYPARKASGFDLNRLHVLAAVLERRAGIALSQYDIHVNVVGGMKANEPAADLAVALAIASSFKDKVLGNDLVVFGEVGLGGEVRSVRFTDKRVKECENLGMKRIILPSLKKQKKNAIKVIPVKNIQELITHT